MRNTQQSRHYSGQTRHYSEHRTTTPVRQYTGTSTTHYGNTIRSTTPVRHVEQGQMRTVETRTIEGEQRIIGERVVEHEVRVPTKKIIEEVVEKVIVVPEKVVREEIVEEVQTKRERIIEVAKPIIQETVVEVPEFEYVENIIEVPEKIVQEKIREVEKVEYQEVVNYVPKVNRVEKIVEVPQVEYREYAVHKTVEVPELREEIVIKEVPVTRYVDVPVAEHVDVEVVQEIERIVPVPVESVTTQEYHLPQIVPRYERVPVPIYAPRFIEVPVPSEIMTAEAQAQAEKFLQEIESVTAHAYPSMCEYEELAVSAKNFHLNIDNDPRSIEHRLRRKDIFNVEQHNGHMARRVSVVSTTSHH